MIAVELGNHLEQFVKKQIEIGRYSSENELFKASIALLEKEDKESFNNLKNALQAGIESGYIPYNRKKFVDKMNIKYR